MFYCKFNGSYYDDKVIWTGLCSRTLKGVWVLEYLVSRHLADLPLVQRHPSQQHRGRLLHVPAQLPGVRRRTRIVLDGQASREVFRAITSIAWTRREEANDLDNFYTMDRTGSEVKGRPELKLEPSNGLKFSSSHLFHVNVHVLTI